MVSIPRRPDPHGAPTLAELLFTKPTIEDRALHDLRLLQQTDRLRDSLRIHERAIENNMTARLLESSGGIERARRELETMDRILNPHRITLEDFTRFRNATLSTLTVDFEQHMRSSENMWTRLHATNHSYASLITEAQRTWERSLLLPLTKASEIGLTRDHAALAAQMSELPSVFSSFCERTWKDMKRVRNEQTADALTHSVSLANRQMGAITGTLSDFLAVPADASAIPTPPAMRLFTVQQEELLARQATRKTDRAEFAFEHDPPSTRTAAKVVEMLELLTNVNQTAQLKSRDEMFKPTTRMMSSAFRIVLLVPTNRVLFGEFLDCLYFLFYEGAGATNLRFLKQQGGPLEIDECSVIWDIKTIRNKFARHDPDHGKEKDIRESHRQLNKTLTRIGIRGVPHNTNNYREIQDHLVIELISFLNLLRAKLLEQ